MLRGRRGLGRKSFCERCNGSTGAWYGEAFADWTTQCLRYASKLRGVSEVLLPFTIQPLNVIKQIVTMGLAVAGTKSSSPLIDGLRRFVLNRQSMQMPTGVDVRAYFNPNDPARKAQQLTQNRLSESCAVLDIRSGTSVFVFAEIAFPPMGYVIYFVKPRDSVSSDFESLCDVRHFGDFHFRQEAAIFMNLPVRYPFGPVPGYYPNLNAKGQRQLLDDDHVVVTSRDRETLSTI